MAKLSQVLHQVGQLLQSWFERDQNREIPLDVCVLEDRVLYSATIMPIDATDLQSDLASQLDQLDQLIAQGLAGGNDTILLPEEFFGTSSSTNDQTVAEDAESSEYSEVEFEFPAEQGGHLIQSARRYYQTTTRTVTIHSPLCSAVSLMPLILNRLI